MRRVVVVDASLPLRVGLTALFRDHGIADVIGTFDHDDALAWAGDWSSVDAMLIGATDPRRTNDQVPGPAIAARLRQRRPPGHATVTVIAPDPSDERVRRRMWEAEADAIVGLTDLCDHDVLGTLVIRPPDPFVLTQPRVSETARILGIERSSRVNRFVERAEDLGVEYLQHEAPDGAPPMRSRWWINLRRDLTETGRLRVVNRDGTAPDRNQRIASLAQLRRVYDWATRL